VSKEISVVYTIYGKDMAMKDKELETLAAKFKGELTSSGCDIPTGERDIQFHFKSTGDAKRFSTEAKRIIAGWEPKVAPKK
jgi:hypothetical protein